jgi:DNA-binding transcriptional MerR regulator
MMCMNAFTIKDLENLSGIKAHTIRIWEQRYDFLKPKRTATNIRYYSNEELKSLLNISLLNKYGYKVSHINRMKAEEIGERVLSLTDPRAEQERIVNTLVQEMVDLDMERFEKILANYIHIKGIERAVIQVIFPFLEKIGILWQTGHINPAQEHLVSNMIRQKLIVGIEATVSHIHTGKTCLLFLPEGEHHEMGLLFMYYMLKRKGLRTIYLGANVPSKDLEYVAGIKKPEYAFVHLTGAAPAFNFEKFLLQCSQKLQGVTFVISGPPAQHYKKKIPANIHLKRSLHEVMDLLASI